MELLDMKPTGYNAEYVTTLFTTLGEDGRNAYLYRQIPVDFVYPLLFAVTNCLLLAFFLKKLNQLKGSLFILCYLPIIAGVTDYLENIGFIFMLKQFPAVSSLWVSITSVFSIIKSFATTMYFIVLIWAMTILGFRVLFKKKHLSTDA